MNKLDKLTLKSSKKRILNNRVITADEHNDVIDGLNTLIDEVVVLQQTEGLLDADIVEALSTANAPSMENPYATVADIPEALSLTTDQIGAIENADGPSAGNYFITISDLGEELEAASLPFPYYIYAAFITQTGSNAPIASVLVNTIGDLVWTRTSAGLYNALTAGLYTVNKTMPNTNIETMIDPVTSNKISAYWGSSSAIHITTKNSSDESIDGALTNRYIEFIVFK